MRELNCMYVNPAKGVQLLTIPDELDTFYELIGCDLIDIVNRKVGGKAFSFIVDDEGLLKSNPMPVLISSDLEPMLFGPAIIVSAEADEEGDLMSLTPEDIEHLANHLYNYGTQDSDKKHACIGDGSY